MKRHMLAATTVVALLFLLTLGAPHASADTVSTHIVPFTGGVCGIRDAFGTVTLTQTGRTSLSTWCWTRELDSWRRGRRGNCFVFNDTAATSRASPRQRSATVPTRDSTGGVSGSRIETAFQRPDGTGDFRPVSIVYGFICTATAGPVRIQRSPFYRHQCDACAIRKPVTLPGTSSLPTSVRGPNRLCRANGPRRRECPPTVPDGGMTLMLLGGALVGLETLRRKFRA